MSERASSRVRRVFCATSAISAYSLSCKNCVRPVLCVYLLAVRGESCAVECRIHTELVEIIISRCNNTNIPPSLNSSPMNDDYNSEFLERCGWSVMICSDGFLFTRDLMDPPTPIYFQARARDVVRARWKGIGRSAGFRQRL